MTPLTTTGAADALPRWAPDGESLAFASDRHTPRRRGTLMRRRLAGADGDPELLATVEGTIEALRWLSGTALLLQVADPEAESPSSHGAVRPEIGPQDPRIIRPVRAWRRLIRLDLETGSQVEVGPEGWTIWEFDENGGHAAVALGSPDPTENGWYHSSILHLDLADRSARVVHSSAWQMACPAISPDGRRVAFLEGWASDRGLVAAEVRTIDLETGESVALEQPAEDVAWIQWRDEASIWFAGIRGVETSYGWIDLAGGRGRTWTFPGTLHDSYQAQVVPSRSGALLATILDTPDDPPEIAWRPVEPAEAPWRRATSLNAWLVDLAAARRVRQLTWPSVDGLGIEGLLVEPTSGPPGPRPLVVDIHGGPTWSHRLGFQPMTTALAIDTGFPVLLVNYRGTPGRGARFTRGNVGDMGGLELQDILSGIDACVRDGIADGARVGVMGGSYGGYLTAWALTQTSRFACGIVISGISDLLSCHRTCNNPAFFEFMLGARPHGTAALALYADRSPVAHIEAARTPTLLIHGEKDLCTPIGQAEEYLQALAEQGIEAELAAYPREGHGVGGWEIDHQRDATARMCDWLVRHLEPERPLRSRPSAAAAREARGSRRPTGPQASLTG